MDVGKAILKRRSVRSYSDKTLSKEKIEEIMNAVRFAPSASNKQDWKFVIATDEEVKESLYEAAMHQRQVKEAPCVIAGVSLDPKDEMKCRVPTGVVDLTIALDHLTLKAAEEDIGTCWIGAFDQDAAKKALRIPDEYRIISLMTMGYPKDPLKRENKNRKDIKAILTYNEF
ncbi:MAG: nitroreductase family protein [Candidatus Hadarchaeia archaeon]